MSKARLLPRETEPASFADYHRFLMAEERSDIEALAARIKGARVVHINATAEGGGVAEMLKSAVPLQNSVGLDSRWYYMDAPAEFFAVSKQIHNALQSKAVDFTDEQKAMYLRVNREIAQFLRDLPRADVYVIHDPQPTGVVAGFHDSPLILRVHPDLSHPHPNVADFLLPFMNQYDMVVFSMKEFSVSGLTAPMQYMFPAIDPLAEKNVPMKQDVAAGIVKRFGIDPRKPLISQVSRFDPWKDPVGVVEAFLRVKKDIPDIQLALVGIIQATDDPEQVEVFAQVKRRTRGEKDVFLFSNPDEIADIGNERLVGAVQAVSDVVLQKSTKEGFGLTVTEAMWKGRPVVAGNVGGIKAQIRNGVDGFLVDSVEQAADRVLEILRDPDLAQRLGASAHERVREKFLITRHLRDHIKLYTTLIRGVAQG